MIFKLPIINRVIACVAFGISLISILSQTIGNATPCQLCLITRYLFLLVAICSFSANYRKWCQFLLITSILSLFFFTFFHLGVENHWWQGPQNCVSQLPSLANIEQEIETNKVYCDRANWIVFGLSSTLWSFLIAAFLTWLTSVTYILNHYLKALDE